MWKALAVLVVVMSLSLFGVAAAVAQEPELEDRVARLESSVRDDAGTGLVLFLFGAFCALWGQNTGRSPWAWFFLGAFFNVVAVVVVLVKNGGERARVRGA